MMEGRPPPEARFGVVTDGLDRGEDRQGDGVLLADLILGQPDGPTDSRPGGSGGTGPWVVAAAAGFATA
jgi:hypothetical protein